MRKKRKNVIGILGGGKDTMTGLIDIAMTGSLYKKGAFHEKLDSYGMVIMDECHHAASFTAQEILTRREQEIPRFCKRWDELR